MLFVKFGQNRDVTFVPVSELVCQNLCYKPEHDIFPLNHVHERVFVSGSVLLFLFCSHRKEYQVLDKSNTDTVWLLHFNKIANVTFHMSSLQ